MVPHSNGMTGLAHRGWRLNDYSHHILHTLRRVGYTSALFGTQHIVSHDQVDQIGYDVALPDGTTQERTQAAVSFLSNSPPQPFFVSVGYFETHRPFHVAQPETEGYAEDERYVSPPPTIPDTLETRRDMADFHASVRVLDRCYGQVLQALDDADLTGNTLVICTTDHGIAFPGMKCTLTDHGIGVLLIMRGPREFSGGKAVDALVSHLDLFPTICDYLAIQPPPWLQGTSFLSPRERLGEGHHIPLPPGERLGEGLRIPLPPGERLGEGLDERLGEGLHQRHTIREEVYAEINYHAAYEPQRCVRTQRYKLIRRFDDRETAVLANCDDSLSKEVWLRAGWQTRPRQQELLFDLAFDPDEANNLALDPDYRDVLQAMRARLIRWMEATDDPLLAGPIPAPQGAVVNAPDALSPLEPTRPANHSPNGGDVRE
jgi:arylsulfatase A-like enzyme